jgi:hypothetical protein
VQAPADHAATPRVLTTTNSVSGRSLANGGWRSLDMEEAGHKTRLELLLCGGAPAGIRTGDPSLPSMRRGFTTPLRTSRPHTSAQAGGAAEGRVVGRGEVMRSAVSGKSLARGATAVAMADMGQLASESSRSDQTLGEACSRSAPSSRATIVSCAR